MTINRLCLWAAAGGFLAYTVFTVAVYVPLRDTLSGTELFSLFKHVLMVLGITAFLLLKPKVGSLVAALWGTVVPLERYALFAREIADGTVLTSETFATSDVLRLALLILATVLSAAVAIQLYARRPVPDARLSVEV
jgi:hypothetical protein